MTYGIDKTEEISRDRQAFEAKLALQNDRITLDIELRTAELEKAKQEKKAQFLAIENKAREEVGAAPTELIQKHRNLLLDFDNLMIVERFFVHFDMFLCL